MPGTVLAASQSVFTDTPARLTLTSNYNANEFAFTYALNNTTGNLSPGESYTCSIFDGSTLIGSATSNAAGMSSGGSSTTVASCIGFNPISSATPQTGFAYVAFPAYLNAGDTYTFLISH